MPPTDLVQIPIWTKLEIPIGSAILLHAYHYVCATLWVAQYAVFVKDRRKKWLTSDEYHTDIGHPFIKHYSSVFIL